MKLTLEKIPTWAYIALLSLYVFSLFYNLNLTALSLEEPRRALVALEMLFNNNYIITTILNETWYDHPPLYNIILALSVKLFGYNTFALRFPCAFSLILTGILVYWLCKTYVSKKFALFAAFYYLICADLYFFFSIIAEIDIFYSLLVFSSVISIFHFYQKKQFYLLFGVSYFFITLAFFTKGFASYAFIGITLLFYFWLKKDIKRLFSLPHVLFVLCSFGCIAIYFYCYNQYENVWDYVAQMWSLTSNRTLSNNNWHKVFLHIITYTGNFFAIIFPATFFLLFLFKKSIFSKVKQHPLMLFLGITFMLNFSIYLISPGARIRYSYMFFPMVIIILVYAWYLYRFQKSRLHNTYTIIFKTLMVSFILGCFIIPFVPYFSIIPTLKYTLPILGIVIIAVFVSYLKLEHIELKHFAIFLFIILVRIGYNMVALPIKSVVSSAVKERTHAQNIYAITSNEPIYVVSTDDFVTFKDIPFTFYRTATYLELYREGLVIKKPKIDVSGYYIVNKEKMANLKLKVLYEFTIKNMNLVLVKKEVL